MRNEEFEQLCYWCEDQELTAVWGWIKDIGGTFNEQREMFFEVLHRLLADGRIRLIHMHTRVPMQGTLDEQIELYRAAFPRMTLK